MKFRTLLRPTNFFLQIQASMINLSKLIHTFHLDICVLQRGERATTKTMGIDYYAILDVQRDASNIEIKLAYRKWATISHPEYIEHPCDVRNPTDAVRCNRPCDGFSKECYWFLLNEAYDVLTNPFYREIYDLYGKESMAKGVATKHGFFPGYLYHGNCRRTYESVFGTYSPYADNIDAVTNPPPLVCTADGKICPKKKDEDVEHLLYVDLKEVFYGGIKKMKILRYEFVDNLKMETKVMHSHLVIPIKRGVLPGTMIRFPEQGDQRPTNVPADIVFIVADKKHEHYTRKGSDLHITQLITLREALCCTKVSITTIDDRKFIVPINDVIK